MRLVSLARDGDKFSLAIDYNGKTHKTIVHAGKRNDLCLRMACVMQDIKGFPMHLTNEEILACRAIVDEMEAQCV